MKKHHLIFASTLLFVALFYEEVPGLNLGIFGLFLANMALWKTPTENRTLKCWAVFAASILSALAFAWYGDLISLLAMAMSLFLLAFVSQQKELKSLLVIPVFAISFLTFIFRVFQFDQWLPTEGNKGWVQRILFIGILPLLLLGIFFGIYAVASVHFAAVLEAVKLDFDFWQIICLTAIGFFLSFNFWNYAVSDFLLDQHHWLNNDFKPEDRITRPTYSFLSMEAERGGGMVTLLGLNILLFFFIVTFNYEQFIELSKTANQLSEETHESVAAVVVSIVMAVFVLMFYFKGSFNFDPKAKTLTILAKIWLFLNALLVLSAFVKNSEYILSLGLTYKRLGVYAFLILCLLGLSFAFLKLQFQKTNAYLFNQMIWYFYGTVLLSSFFNWGGIITAYNMQRKDFAPDDHDPSIEFNERPMLHYYQEKGDQKKYLEMVMRIRNARKSSALSKHLYFEYLDVPGEK